METPTNRSLPDVIAGPDVVTAALAALGPALEAFEAVDRFVGSEHGRAVAAYWRALEELEREQRSDDVNDAHVCLIRHVDAVLLAIVDRITSLASTYEVDQDHHDELRLLEAVLHHEATR